MTTIVAASTLVDVFNAHYAKWIPSPTDTAAWKTLTAATGDAKVVTTVGLFGIDLAAFLADCALATTNCKSADYADYNGWGAGVSWTATSVPTDADFDTVSFVEDLLLVGVSWDTTENNAGNAKIDTGLTFAAAVPSGPADLTGSTVPGPFKGAWDGAA